MLCVLIQKDNGTAPLTCRVKVSLINLLNKVIPTLLCIECAMSVVVKLNPQELKSPSSQIS